MRSRRRDAVLECVELFRGSGVQVTLTQVMAFLYIAENEGLSITELGLVCGTTLPTASRAARSLYPSERPEALPPFLGLVEPHQHPAIAHGRLLHLTGAGEQLRDRIDGIIRDAAPICAREGASISQM